MGSRLAITPQEAARLSALGPVTPQVMVPQPTIAPAPNLPSFASAAPSGAAAGGPIVGGGTPRFGLSGLDIAGIGASGAGGLISSIGSFFKKGPSFSEKFAGLKSTIPARARIPFSPQQRELLPQMFNDLQNVLSEVRQRSDPLNLFAQGLEFNTEAISDLKNRAMAFRDRAQTNLQGGA